MKIMFGLVNIAFRGINTKLIKCSNIDTLQRICHQSTISSRPDWVAIGDDGNFLCWHPEQHHPYEHTKELPEPKPDAMANSVLKTQCSDDIQYVRQKTNKYLMRKKLMEMTFTPKYKWFTNPRMKYL